MRGRASVNRIDTFLSGIMADIRRFFPFRKLVYHVPLPPEEIVRRLENAVELPDTDVLGIGLPGPRRIVKKHAYFTGTVGRKFSLYRKPQRRRHSPSLVIQGVMSESGTGTLITVEIRPILWKLVFVCVWLAGFFWLAFQFLRVSVASGHYIIMMPPVVILSLFIWLFLVQPAKKIPEISNQLYEIFRSPQPPL